MLSCSMIGILTAMSEESEPFEAHFTEERCEKRFGLTFRIGTIGGIDVVLVTSGIGTTNATIATTILIERYGSEQIIMSGVAGGIGSARIGEVLIAHTCVYHDVDATAFGYASGQVPREPERFESARARTFAQGLGIRSGIIASGNAFVSDPQRVSTIKETFAADAIDMESAAVAHVCTHAGVEWIIIRGMSDHADEEAKESFDERLGSAAKSAARTAIRVITDAN